MSEIENRWRPEIALFAPDACRIIVGTKCGLRVPEPSPAAFFIIRNQGLQLCEQFGLEYVECSAVDGNDLDEILDAVTEKITDRDSDLGGPFVKEKRVRNRNRWWSCCQLL